MLNPIKEFKKRLVFTLFKRHGWLYMVLSFYRFHPWTFGFSVFKAEENMDNDDQNIVGFSFDFLFFGVYVEVNPAFRIKQDRTLRISVGDGYLHWALWVKDTEQKNKWCNLIEIRRLFFGAEKYANEPVDYAVKALDFGNGICFQVAVKVYYFISWHIRFPMMKRKTLRLELRPIAPIQNEQWQSLSPRNQNIIAESLNHNSTVCYDVDLQVNAYRAEMAHKIQHRVEW